MPDTIEFTINGDTGQIASGRTVADLVEQLELNPRQIAVEVNLQLVPRESHAKHALSSGDRIEVVTLVGGG